MSQLFIPKDVNEAKNLSKLCKAKKVRRICRGIYTDDLRTAIPEIK